MLHTVQATVERRQAGWRLGRWEAGLLAVAGVALAGFMALPGDLTAKAHMALHGLCAQRPAHTFALGGTPLPFDARMTGIYLGVLVAGLPLLLARRRGTAVSWRWLGLLLGGIVVMGLDGLNSLRADLGLAVWWPPANWLRLVTGVLAGVSLGVGLVWLLNVALWPAEERLLRPADALGWLIGLGVGTAVVLSGAGWALTPVTVLLLGGAVFALAALNLAFVSMVLSRNESHHPWRDATARRVLARALTLALGATVLQMALLAGGRYVLEAMLGRGLT